MARCRFLVDKKVKDQPRVTFSPSVEQQSGTRTRGRGSQAEKYPDLDASVVTAALSAGVSEKALQEMQKLIGLGLPKAKKLQEPALGQSPKRMAKKDVLSESESEEEDDAGDSGLQSFLFNSCCGKISSPAHQDSFCFDSGEEKEVSSVSGGSGAGWHFFNRSDRFGNFRQWKEGGGCSEGSSLFVDGVARRDLSAGGKIHDGGSLSGHTNTWTTAADLCRLVLGSSTGRE